MQLRAAGVKDPEAVLGVKNDGLDADEVVLVVRACWRAGGIVYGATRRAVDLDIGVGCLGGVTSQLSDLVLVVTAGVGVVGV